MSSRQLVKARRIQKAQQAKLEPVRHFSLGVLVGETDTSPTADVAGRPEYVWCSEFGQPQSKFSILNRAVPAVVGLPVKIGYPEKPPFERQVLGVWGQIGTLPGYNDDEGAPFDLPAHRITHQWPSEANKGTDAVKIWSPALMMLKTEATTGMNIMLRPHVYWHEGVADTFPGAVADLTGYIPGAGEVRYVLVYLDVEFNAIGIEEGTAVTDDGVTPIPLPTLPDNARPSAFVKMYDGQTAVSQTSDVFDTRDWLGLGDGGTSGGPYEATEIGQMLVSVDGSTFEPRLPLTTNEGYVLTNNEGYILFA
jgi:hypothetical protein